MPGSSASRCSLDTLTEGLKQIGNADKTASLLIDNRIPELSELLAVYINEIERFNPIYGLVKAANREELIIKHILDSLAPLGHIARLLEEPETGIAGKIGFADKVLADAGSGAGLPGIPLAICLPGIKVILIERMGRRAGFLQNVLAVLGLSSRVTVEETDVARVTRCCNVVTLRALSPLKTDFTANLMRLLEPGGVIAAYKGRAAKTELTGLSGYAAELIPLTVPFLAEERYLALVWERHGP